MSLFDDTTTIKRLSSIGAPGDLLHQDLSAEEQWQRILGLVESVRNETVLHVSPAVPLLDYVFGPGTGYTIQDRAKTSKRRFSHHDTMVHGHLMVKCLAPFDPDCPGDLSAWDALIHHGFAALLDCVDAGVKRR